MIDYRNVTWEQTAQAVNNIFKGYHNASVTDYVGSCANNALPMVLPQMMATALAEGLTLDNEDVAVMVNAYKQLSEKGFIGEGVGL